MKAAAKIYFIACCFPPVGRGNALTNACVANYLADFFDVEVICIKEPHSYLLSYQKDESLVKNLNPRLSIRRVDAAQWWGLNEILYGIGLLPCYYLNWAWQVLREDRGLAKGRGVIFAVYPVFSDLVVAYFLHRRYGHPLLVDFRDDFSGVMSRGWRSLLGWGYRWLERWVVRAADSITVTTEHLKQDLVRRHGLDAAKISVVWNVVPPARRQGRSASEAGCPFTVIYAGAISRHQRPEVLLKAYRSLLDRHPELRGQIRVEIYGPRNRYFKRHVEKYLGAGIEFKGFVPREQVVEQIARADVGFLSLGDRSLAYATPTKLFEYIDLEKPVLAVLPAGVARELIEDLRIGLVADLGDEDRLAQHLYDLYREPRLRAEFTASIRKIKEGFSPERQVGRWRALVDQLSGGYTAKKSVP